MNVCIVVIIPIIIISIILGRGLAFPPREPVQLHARLPARRLCLGLRAAVRRLPAGRLGEVRAGAVRHRLLHRLARVQPARGGALLHSGALHLLLHPALLRHHPVLLRHPGDGAFFTQEPGAARSETGAHDQHPDCHR